MEDSNRRKTNLASGDPDAGGNSPEEQNINNFLKPDDEEFSIGDLRRISQTLLHNPSKKKSTDAATIFDLCWEDRKRVGGLIAQLTSVEGKLMDLQEKCSTLVEDKERYKTKSNDLMKKVDSLSEKCQRLNEEKLKLKEKHLLSLNALHSSVINISDQFDISDRETQRLRATNSKLHLENISLKEQITTLKNKLESAEKLKRLSPSVTCLDQSTTRTKPTPKIITQETDTTKEDKLLEELFFRF